LTGVVQEIIFSGEGASSPFFQCGKFDLTVDPPAIIGEERSGAIGGICLYGFALDEPISVDLFAPDGSSDHGEFIAQQNTMFRTTVTGGLIPVGDAGQNPQGFNYMLIRFRVPAGQPTGTWNAVAQSQSVSASGEFSVSPLFAPALGIYPAADFTRFDVPPYDPSVDWACSLDATGPAVRVIGEGFGSDQSLPVGVYYMRPEAPTGTWTLVRGQLVTTDSLGGFQTDLPVEPSDVSGYYFANIPFDPASGSDRPGVFDCYRVP
jgi:hypothetical protein